MNFSLPQFLKAFHQGQQRSAYQYGYHHRLAFALILILANTFGSTPVSATVQKSSPLQIYNLEVVQSLPHSRDAFTQGLALYNGSMIESSGLYGRSFIQRFHPQTNQLAKKRRLDRRIFAEGIAVSNGRLYLLSWKLGKVLRYDPETFERQDYLTYQGEGWGLASLGEQLVMSNGTATLTYRSPETFAPLKTIDVSLNGRALHKLNALATTDTQSPFGELIWANVWKDNRLFSIDPKTGKVVGLVDLSTLVEENRSKSTEDVLNGVAWDTQRQGFWVTGKRWKTRYLIRLTAPNAQEKSQPTS